VTFRVNEDHLSTRELFDSKLITATVTPFACASPRFYIYKRIYHDRIVCVSVSCIFTKLSQRFQVILIQSRPRSCEFALRSWEGSAAHIAESGFLTVVLVVGLSPRPRQIFNVVIHSYFPTITYSGNHTQRLGEIMTSARDICYKFHPREILVQAEGWSKTLENPTACKKLMVAPSVYDVSKHTDKDRGLFTRLERV
jgi:hypothetical protein